jgi:hypothetical protein
MKQRQGIFLNFCSIKKRSNRNKWCDRSPIRWWNNSVNQSFHACSMLTARPVDLHEHCIAFGDSQEFYTKENCPDEIFFHVHTTGMSCFRPFNTKLKSSDNISNSNHNCILASPLYLIAAPVSRRPTMWFHFCSY